MATALVAPKEVIMPEQRTLERARKDKREGKSRTTQAGEFVREEIRHVRSGKHGARSAKQAIAIGLSKARRAGVRLPPPKGKVSEKTRLSAAHATTAGNVDPEHKPAPRRSRAIKQALKPQGPRAPSAEALARQASSAARQRAPAEPRASAPQGTRQRSAAQRSANAR